MGFRELSGHPQRVAIPGVHRALAACSSPSTPPEDLISDCFLDVSIFSLGKRFACSMTKNLSPNGVGAKPLKTLSVLQVTDGEADNSIITQNLFGHKNAFSKKFWNLKE